MALCNTVVNTVYCTVMENVIENIKDIFTDEGIDEQILQNLKTLWKTKLLANCKSVKENQSNVERFAHGVKRKARDMTAHKTQDNEQVLNTLCRTIQPRLDNEIIPIRVTIPMLPVVNARTRVLTLYVPANVVNQAQLQNLLAGPVITATMGLPTSLAKTLLQQHINAEIEKQQKQQQMTVRKIIMPQIDGESDETSQISENVKHFENVFKCAKGSINIQTISLNVDGASDTSDEENSKTEDCVLDSSVDEEKDDAEKKLYSTENPPEEILNSDDDITDEESDNQLDTNNIIVCQFDKIARSRNRWRLYLKNGVMNVDGEDFIFHGLMGEAEW